MSSSLIDDGPEGVNTPEFSVSEISFAVKRTIEGEFGHVRVRGEVGRVSRPRSGHVYLDLKDDRAVLNGVVWKGVSQRLEIQPQEGDEVIATGRLTTFPGQSKYQLVIESMAYAGEGALLAKLDRLRKALAAEGLFAAERKRPIPYLPRVIGVVTSPSGAVIRDILHRLAERFPVHVLVWPVAVQGAKCAPEVAAAIRGFDGMDRGGAIPRPDLLIVARGGGSVEDLWGFNEEVVVRAAADCSIPLISAVGHETDTTLIDYAADLRAPTPTAAAELAVPVRAELVAGLAELDGRRVRALALALQRGRETLRSTARALPRPEQMLAERRQRLDVAVARLPRADALTVEPRHRLERAAGALPAALRTGAARERQRFSRIEGRVTPALVTRRLEQSRDRLTPVSRRLAPEFVRMVREGRASLDKFARLLGTLGYHGTLARGYAVVRGAEGQVLTRAATVNTGDRLEIEFADGRRDAVAGSGTASPRAKRTASRGSGSGGGSQGSLF